MMQFGATRSLRLFSCGLYWFFGPDSVYWGHNALIRIAPFKAHCNLPIMPGRPPLGGDILSQDIVEAALLGRAGWAVEWDVEKGGSFDEMPANLETYGKRDRRWCQGNFQHFWLIFADGIRAAHRFYFANGIFAYAGSAGLLVLALIGFIQGLGGRVYLHERLSLLSFLSFLIGILLIPRILGFVTTFPRQRIVRELLSHFLEVLLSILISPALFYMHTRFTLEILVGKEVSWGTQSRNPKEELSWKTSARLFAVPSVIAILWGGLAFKFTPSFIIYLGPILGGWLLSIPVAKLTSDLRIGQWLTRHHIFADRLSDHERTALGPLLTPECPGTGASAECPAAELAAVSRVENPTM
jgi:membrane glycosyltransferase